MCFFNKTTVTISPIRTDLPRPLEPIRDVVRRETEILVMEYRVRISDAKPMAADAKTDRRFTFYKHETGEMPER